MFLNLFFEQFIFDVHKQTCLEQPILILIFLVTCTFYLMENVSVSKVCLKFSIFPPKNLEKYRRPKYACAVFYFFYSRKIQVLLLLLLQFIFVFVHC